MAKKREIVYEPHPVSPERKRELLGQGYKILDARFAPGFGQDQGKSEGGADGAEDDDGGAKPARRGRPPKSEQADGD